MEGVVAERHLCDVCGKAYSRRDALNRHRRTSHEDRQPTFCAVCDRQLNRKDDLARHMRSVHGIAPAPRAPPAVAAPRPPPVVAAPRQPLDNNYAQDPSPAVPTTSAFSPLAVPSTSSGDGMDLEPATIAVNDPQPRPKHRPITCPHCLAYISYSNYSRHMRFNCPRLRGEPAAEPTLPAQVGRGQDHTISDSESEEEGIPSVLSNSMAPAGFVEVETGFKNRLKTFRLEVSPTVTLTIPEFLL